MDPAASISDPVEDDPDAARLARFVAAAALSAVDTPGAPGAQDPREEAFAELVASAGPGLYAFVVRFLGRPEDALDVYQEVWIKVARNAGRFDRRARFATWLYRIARNACVDHLRRERRKPRNAVVARENGEDGGDENPSGGRAYGGVDPQDCPSGEPGPAERAASNERLGRVMAAVAELSEAQREVFLLREEAGLSFEEIGVMLGCGRETAKSRMRYALERLRFLLAAEARAEGWR